MNKQAINIGELISQTPINIKNKSKNYRPRLLKSLNNIWIYNVGDYTVRIKYPKIQKRLRALLTEKQYNKLRQIKNRDVLISCTCNYWKWNGPDFNAANNGYSERSFSDLSDPVVRDPEHKNLICKHVYAALVKFKRDVKDAQ